MTLIIGIRCSDGVVMGADGAATYVDALGNYTSRQPHKKIEIIAKKIVVGTSGPVGMAQKFRAEVQGLWEMKAFSDKKPHEATAIIKKSIWPHVASEKESAAIAQQVHGIRSSQGILFNTLIALPVSKSPCLFHFDHQCSSEEVVTTLPCVSIGSGQQIADPFLAFLKRIFWKEKELTINDGIFAVFWALSHGVLTCPGGVADPKQIVVMEKQSGDWEARELTADELKDHNEAVDAAEKHVAKFLTTQEGQGVGKPPEPNDT